MTVSKGFLFGLLGSKADKSALDNFGSELVGIEKNQLTALSSLVAQAYSREAPPVVIPPLAEQVPVFDEAQLQILATTGQPCRLEANIVLTQTLDATGINVNLNGFALRTAGTDTDPVTMITSTGGGLIYGGTIEHNKTTDTTVEAVFGVNNDGAAIFRVRNCTIRVQEFAAVLNGAFDFTSNKLEYHSGLNDSHRYFRIQSVLGSSYIDDCVFDCQPRNGTTRYTNFILLQPSEWTDGAILHVRRNKQGVGDLRQFMIGDTIGVNVQEGRMVIHGNEWDDFNGGVFLLGVNRFDQFAEIVVTGNKQGGAAVGNFKGLFYVDGDGDLGTKCNFVHFGNTTEGGPLRAGYRSIDSGSDNIIAVSASIETDQNYTETSPDNAGQASARSDQFVAALRGTTAELAAQTLNLQNTKVDVEEGKGLSQNDFTNADKTKLENIATEATKNATDAELRDRATHIGTQPMESIQGLENALNSKVNAVEGKGLSQNDFTNADKEALDLAIYPTSPVGSWPLVSGLEVERDQDPKDGYIRFNETAELPEMYYRDSWRKLPSDPDDVGFDLIALFGQSNMVGYGSTRSDFIDLEDSRIWQFCDLGRNFSLNNGAFYRQRIKAREPLEHERKGGDSSVGPGLAFAREYLAGINSNRKVLLVPAASGSTGFADGHWTVGGQFFENAMNQLNLALQAAGPNARFVGMCWVQGEQDSIRAMPGADYTAAFRAMWAEIKARTNTPDAWCVLGSMVHEWTFNSDLNTNRANKIRIWDEHAALPGVEERLWFVTGPEGAGAANSAADLIHYNAVAMRKLGFDMYHLGYLQAIRNKEERPALVRNFALDGNVTIGVRASWQAQFNVQYDLRWRYVGATEWVVIPNITGVAVVIPSDADLEIEAQVRAFRGDGADRQESPYTNSVTATSTPTLLQGLLFRMTPDDIVTSTFNGQYDGGQVANEDWEGVETGATYVSRWLDSSGNNAHFETVYHGSTAEVRDVTMTEGSNIVEVGAVKSTLESAGLFVGSAPYCDGIPYGTRVTAIDGNILTLSSPATATQTAEGTFYKPLTRNRSAAVTQPVGFGRPRFAEVQGIPAVIITNEWKSLWNRVGITGNNSYTKTWIHRHVAINTIPGQLAVGTDGGANAQTSGSRNYTSCYVNTATTGADSTLTWTGGTTGSTRLNFAHNSLIANATDPNVVGNNRWDIFTCTFDRTDGQMRLYRNGVQVGQFVNTSVLKTFSMYLGAIDLGPFRAGAEGAAFIECITHNRVLDEIDVQNLADYMSLRYGITWGQ